MMLDACFHYILLFSAAECELIEDNMMLDACFQNGFTSTAFPNYIGNIGQDSAAEKVLLLTTIESATGKNTEVEH